MSCDPVTRLMRPSGRALGLMQRTISAYAAGSGDICNRLTASRRRHADDGIGMTAARRCRQIAPDHPSAHGPPGRASAPVPGDHPSAHAPRDDDAMPAQGPGGSDAATEQGAPASAVYDPQARAFYDAETGALLADEAAWERASEDQRDKARNRLTAVRRAEDLIALVSRAATPMPLRRRRPASPAAFSAAGAARCVACPGAPASPRCSMPGAPAGRPRSTQRTAHSLPCGQPCGEKWRGSVRPLRAVGKQPRRHGKRSRFVPPSAAGWRVRRRVPARGRSGGGAQRYPRRIPSNPKVPRPRARHPPARRARSRAPHSEGVPPCTCRKDRVPARPGAATAQPRPG